MTDDRPIEIRNGGFYFRIPNSLVYRLCIGIEQHMTEAGLTAWHLLPEAERHEKAVALIFGSINTDALRHAIADVINLPEREVFYKRVKK